MLEYFCIDLEMEILLWDLDVNGCFDIDFFSTDLEWDLDLDLVFIVINGLKDLT